MGGRRREGGKQVNQGGGNGEKFHNIAQHFAIEKEHRGRKHDYRVQETGSPDPHSSISECQEYGPIKHM